MSGRSWWRRASGLVSRSAFRLASLLTIIAILVASAAPVAAADFLVLPDYPIPNGHFYSQASGSGTDAGFSVVDDSAASFFSEFNRLRGVSALGYPASRRFILSATLTQATQKALLQWHPELQRAVPANTFDIFSQLGLDPLLAQADLIPPTPDNRADRGLAWNQVVARHLALLNQNAQIKARYFSDPDPITDFGLPQAVADYRSVVVIRCQRATFQFWRVSTSFARPGDVTQVNAGDLAKDLGVVPAAAAVPLPATTQVVAPPGPELTEDPTTIATASQAAAAAAPSLVRIDVSIPGGAGVGSGIVFDARGDILTAEHVVDAAQSIQVTLNTGAASPARVVGVDVADDVAVIQVPSPFAGQVRPARFGSGLNLAAGQPVVAIGYSPYFPVPPAVRLGTFQRVESSSVNVLRTDSFILPGDSGGMLLDLNGNVVGVIDAIRITDEPDQPLVGFSIDAADATRIAQGILRGGGTPTAYLGAQIMTVTPEVQAAIGLPADYGALVDGVTSGGPADQAGLAVGDIVLQADGSPVTSVPDLAAVIGRERPGDHLELGVIGERGASVEIDVVLGTWPGASGA